MEALPLGAQHEHRGAVEPFGEVVRAAGPRGQSVDPGAGLLEVLQGPGQVHHAHQGNAADGARAGAHHRLVHLRGPAFGEDHPVHPGGRGRAQDGAEIVRIGHAVQHEHQGRRAALPDPLGQGVHGPQGDGLAFAQDALVALALGPAVQAVHGFAVDDHALLPGLGSQLGATLPGRGRDAQGLEFAPQQGLLAGVGSQESNSRRPSCIRRTRDAPCPRPG